MYCPKCMIEIQYNSDMTCPYCTTPLVEKSPQSDDPPMDNKSNHPNTSFEAQSIIRDAQPHNNFASVLQESQEKVYFLDDEIDEAVGETIGIDKVDAVFRQILDAKAGPSDDVSAGHAIESTGSNTSTSSHQNNSQQLLDKAFEEIDTDDESTTAPSAKSLAITLVLGALVLVCVFGTGIYYLNHIPAHEAIIQKPDKILSLPSANAPAPILKNSRGAEQHSPAAITHTTQDVSQAVQDGLADQTQGAGVQQKNSSPPGEFAAPQATSPALPEQINSQPQQKNEAMTGGTETQQKSSAASAMHTVTNSGTGSHILLCGSFQDKNKALNLAKKIKDKGYPAFVEKADLELKGIWYRIKVAGFSSKIAAEKARDELKGKLKLEAVVAKQK